MPVRDERGVAFPSPVVMLSVIAVAMAGIAFVVTQDDGGEQTRQVAEQPSATPSADETEPPEKEATPPKKKRKPVVKRGTVYLEVYNQTSVSGLAGRTADEAAAKGWQVAGTDNWYGTIPASTVYYPAKLEAAARLLAKDLGIDRLMPATGSMRPDRLTVVLAQ